jgi:hypothetical protein
MGHLRLRGRAAAGAASAALLVAGAAPAGALAAGKPAATTGAAASITQSTATLTGTVTPNGAASTYFFQYGTTTVYGATTPATTAAAKQTVAVPVGALAPFTVYHYRLVAQNSHGLTKGKDRTFKTKRQPLGVSLIGNPNPVPFGKPTTLQGILSGTGNAKRPVILQANPFPYTQGFVNAPNAQLTNDQGQFFFTLPALAINTQFRVVMTDRHGLLAGPPDHAHLAAWFGRPVLRLRDAGGRRVDGEHPAVQQGPLAHDRADRDAPPQRDVVELLEARAHPPHGQLPDRGERDQRPVRIGQRPPAPPAPLSSASPRAPRGARGMASSTPALTITRPNGSSTRTTRSGAGVALDPLASSVAPWAPPSSTA